MAEILKDSIDFSAYMRETEPQQKVKPARAWVQELINSLGQEDYSPKSYLPWSKTHPHFVFRPGEVTLWAGENGGGKSLLTGQATLGLMAQGDRCCIASFEMKPKKTLERMSRQFSGQSPYGEWMKDEAVLASYREIYDQFGIFTEKKLWLYDQQGSVKTDMLIAVIRYCADKLKINHFFIDSLMKCVNGTDDYNAQKDFVEKLCTEARDLNIHIHLVHHIRKQEAEGKVPDKAAIKGAGEIADQVDNILLVHRNKAKEKDRALGKAVADTDPDTGLICCKQRNGEWEGTFALWYERESQQFVEAPGGAVSTFDGSDFPRRKRAPTHPGEPT